jgi:membrane-associated phospholipid phosphatase
MSTVPHGNPARLRSLHERFIVEERLVAPHVRRNLYIWAGSLAAVGLAGFLVILAAVLHHDGITGIDVPIEHGLGAIRNQPLTVAMIGLAILFGPIVLPIIILVAIVLWTIFAKHFWRPLLLAAGTLTGVIVVQLIAHAVGRSRPPVAHMLFGPDLTFSFPSGHVLGASDFLLIGAYLIVSRRPSARAPITGFAVAIVLVLLAAVCRVYLGYHWPTDALASMCLALIILGSIIAIDTRRTIIVRSE